MDSFQVPCPLSLYCLWTPGTWCCHILVLGPLGESALARVRFLSRDVARAEATLVSYSSSRPEVRAHAMGQLKCRVRDRGWLSFQCRVLVLGKVRFRSQETPGAEPTVGQWSPLRAELSTQGSVQVSISVWLPRSHTSMGPWSRRPPESSGSAAARLGKRHAELPGSMPCEPAPLLDPRHVVLSDVGIGSPWGECLS